VQQETDEKWNIADNGREKRERERKGGRERGGEEVSESEEYLP
jgi:hypothetical protein